MQCSVGGEVVVCPVAWPASLGFRLTVSWVRVFKRHLGETARGGRFCCQGAVPPGSSGAAPPGARPRSTSHVTGGYGWFPRLMRRGKQPLAEGRPLERAPRDG